MKNMDEVRLSTRDQMAFELLKAEANNVWTWAGKTKDEQVAYCYKMVDAFLAANDRANLSGKTL